MHSLDFFIRELLSDDRTNAGAVNEREGAETNVADAVFAFVERGDGESGFCSAAERLNDMSRCHTDTVYGAALTSDDLTARLSNVVFYVFSLIIVYEVVGRCNRAVEFRKRNACDGSGRPGNEGSVTVFTENVCVNLLLIDVVDLSTKGLSKVFSNTMVQKTLNRSQKKKDFMIPPIR